MRASRSPIAATGSFVTAAVTQGYAPLDRYLMGFAPPSDVPDTFVVLNPSVSPLGHPQSGVAFTGSRLNISANDVIQAMGRRTPDHTVAQHRFRFGFILVVPQGSQDSVDRRQRAAGGDLPPAVRRCLLQVLRQSGYRRYYFESQPAAVAVPGGRRCGGRQRHGNGLRCRRRLKTDLVVRLAAPAGFVQVPAQVTIAAGATSASLSPSRESRREWRNCWPLPPIRVTKLRSRACRWPRRRNSRCGKQSAIPFQETSRCS